MQRNPFLEADSKFFLEFFKAILKAGGIRWVRCGIISVMGPVKEGKQSGQVDPLDAEWREHIEYAGSVPETEREALVRTLQGFEFDYELKPSANNRLDFVVREDQVVEKFELGRQECSLLYFICLYIQRMKDAKAQLEKYILGNPNQSKNVFFRFHPNTDKIEYYGFENFLGVGRSGLPACAVTFIKTDQEDSRGKFLEWVQPKHIKRSRENVKMEKKEIEWKKGWERIPNLFFLASIMHCQFVPRPRNKGASLTAAQEVASQFLSSFFPPGVKELVLDYILPGMSPQFIQFVKKKIPQEYARPRSKNDTEKYYQLTLTDIQELMRLLPENYEDYYSGVDKAYNVYVENAQILRALFTKLNNHVSNEALFVSNNVFDSFRKGFIEKLKWQFVIAPNDISGFYEKESYGLILINNFWKQVSADKDNPYYAPLSDFFCCKDYEVEHQEPFPDEITEEILLWVAAQPKHQLKKEPSLDKKDEPPRQTM